MKFRLSAAEAWEDPGPEWGLWVEAPADLGRGRNLAPLSIGRSPSFLAIRWCALAITGSQLTRLICFTLGTGFPKGTGFTSTHPSGVGSSPNWKITVPASRLS
jgi:hypothetical protein